MADHVWEAADDPGVTEVIVDPAHVWFQKSASSYTTTIDDLCAAMPSSANVVTLLLISK